MWPTFQNWVRNFKKSDITKFGLGREKFKRVVGNWKFKLYPIRELIINYLEEGLSVLGLWIYILIKYVIIVIDHVPPKGHW